MAWQQIAGRSDAVVLCFYFTVGQDYPAFGGSRPFLMFSGGLRH